MVGIEACKHSEWLVLGKTECSTGENPHLTASQGEHKAVE